MKTVRFGTFETNSSSTHSLVMCSSEEFEDFKAGKLYFDKYNDCLCTPEEIDKDEEYSYITYDEFLNMDNYETFEDSYKTKNGDSVVAFGYFGYNG